MTDENGQILGVYYSLSPEERVFYNRIIDGMSILYNIDNYDGYAHDSLNRLLYMMTKGRKSIDL